jgi:hypothetical protein
MMIFGGIDGGRQLVLRNRSFCCGMRSCMSMYVYMYQSRSVGTGRVDSALQVFAMIAGSRTWPDVTSTLSGR